MPGTNRSISQRLVDLLQQPLDRRHFLGAEIVALGQQDQVADGGKHLPRKPDLLSDAFQAHAALLQLKSLASGLADDCAFTILLGLATPALGFVAG